MKSNAKKMTAAFVAIVLAVTMMVAAPMNLMIAEAASAVYINPYSAKAVTYKPGDAWLPHSSVISIVGCDKKSQIKNLKSSNKAVKAIAADGYIRVEYGNKPCKTTITCTVKNKKLKTTFEVRKYTNPFKVFKIGSTNLKSKYDKVVNYSNKKTFKAQKLTLQMNTGWKITTVGTCEKGKYNYSDVNSTKYSKKINLTKNYDSITIICENKKLGITESITYFKGSY